MTENMRDTQERLIGHPSGSESNQNVPVEAGCLLLAAVYSVAVP